MNNSIEAVIKALTADNKDTEKLDTLIGKISEAIDSQHKQQNDTVDRFQIKINLISSIIPLLDDNSKPLAHYLIKLLTIISTLKQINSIDN